MQVIVSHDIDHIKAFEHLTDLFLLKHLSRSLAELFNRHISSEEFKKRIFDILKNKFENVSELAEFDLENNVKPTFFIAVNNGLSLSYNGNNAKILANSLIIKGIPVGVHGIDYDSFEDIKNESDKFKILTGLESFGIRMHYLRISDRTLEFLDQSGYSFDSSVFCIKNPYKVGNLWEFPIQLMDSYIFYGKSKYQVKSLEEIRSETVQHITKAVETDLKYFTIVVHDFYYSDSFVKWKNWYEWLITYLKSGGHEFVNFNDAITQLSSINFSIENIK
jgi:hypothetical protein